MILIVGLFIDIISLVFFALLISLSPMVYHHHRVFVEPFGTLGCLLFLMINNRYWSFWYLFHKIIPVSISLNVNVWASVNTVKYAGGPKELTLSLSVERCVG